MNIIVYFVVAIVVLLFGVLTSRARIAKLVSKYITIGNSANMTGIDFVNLAANKLDLNISLATSEKTLSDAYYAKGKVVILSNAVANYSSIASVAIAAHEIGHAVQDRQNNRLFHLHEILYRIARFTNKFVALTLFGGFIVYGLAWFGVLGPEFLTYGLTASYVGVGLFVFNLVVKLISIPIEYDASKKALTFLKDYKIISKTEIRQVKRILNVAALTYVASLFDGIILFGKRIASLSKGN